jgi:hypothetical protein
MRDAMTGEELRYGYELGNQLIVAPKGWKILPEGVEVPQEHREYILGVGWASPRRCRSTMTPIRSMVYGSVMVYAVPEC